MSRIGKLMQKFRKKPESVSYCEIEILLEHCGFEKVPAKGSHVKWKHGARSPDIIIPVHNNECKVFYKKQIRKQLKI